jgi:uncharacterized membrane protein YbhN (UPF0104 family)
VSVPEPAAKPPSFWRSPWVRRGLRLLPLLLLVLVFMRQKPWAATFTRPSFAAGLAMIALNFGIYIPVKAWRWRTALQAPPRFTTLVASLLEGWLAGTAVGFGSADVVRVVRLRGHAGAFAADYGAGVAERGAELVAMAVLLALGAVVGNLGWPALAGAGAILTGYAVVLLFGPRIAPLLRRWPRVATAIHAGLAASRPRVVAGMTLLSLAGWACEVVMLSVGLRSAGLPADASTALLVLIGINVAIVVPGPPANLGTLEAGAVAALGLRGVKVEPAVMFAVGYHLILTVPVMIAGAVVFFARGGSRSAPAAPGADAVEIEAPAPAAPATDAAQSERR